MYTWILAIVPKSLMLIDVNNHLAAGVGIPAFGIVRLHFQIIPNGLLGCFEMLGRNRVADDHVTVVIPEFAIFGA